MTQSQQTNKKREQKGLQARFVLGIVETAIGGLAAELLFHLLR